MSGRVILILPSTSLSSAHCLWRSFVSTSTVLLLLLNTDVNKTRAHRAHTPRAMAISPMAMPLLRGLYSLKFNLLLLTNFFVPF